MAYLKSRRNFVLGGVNLGDETIDSAGNDIIVPENGNVTGEVLPANGNGSGFGGSMNVFGVNVPIIYLLGGAAAGYFLGNKSDALRNAALGAGAGVAISYFVPTL